MAHALETRRPNSTALADVVTQTGLDLLTLGSTKNGTLCGAALVLMRMEHGRQARFALTPYGQRAP